MLLIPKYKVYATDEWWGDSWDGLSYGRDFDFSRPFFEQFHELQLEVPRIALFNVNPFNSDYCQQAYNNKNCYLCTVLKDCEDCMYISHSNNLRDCYDCDYVQHSELCYECTDGQHLYACIGCEHCINCHELYFCIDCIGSSNCIGCWGLRNQKYCIFNKQYTKEEFQEKLALLKLSNWSSFIQARSKIQSTIDKGNQRTDFNINTIDCTGNRTVNAQNCHECYDSFDIEECSHCTWIFESHHSADVYGMGTSDWVYESLGVENLHFGAFNTFVSDSGECFYSDLCFYSTYLFGCVGLRNKKYCILNKEYSRDEFTKLREAIVEHMKKTEEWGKFFPPNISPFAYNESVAQERFPLTKEEAVSLGFSWRDPDPKEFRKQTYQIPDSSLEVTEDITKQVLACEKTGKNFRIEVKELEYLKKMGLPIPRFCPDERYSQRMKRRFRY